MAFEVRVYCENEEIYKYESQTTLDDTWVPASCEEHTIRDFVVEEET